MKPTPEYLKHFKKTLLRRGIKRFRALSVADQKMQYEMFRGNLRLIIKYNAAAAYGDAARDELLKLRAALPPVTNSLRPSSLAERLAAAYRESEIGGIELEE